MLIRTTDYHVLFYELYNKMCLYICVCIYIYVDIYVCIYTLLRLVFTKDLAAFTSGHC